MDVAFSLKPDKEDRPQSSFTPSNMESSLAVNPSTYKTTMRRRRYLTVAVIVSIFVLVVSLTVVILALYYKIVPLARTASLQRTRCFITKIDSELVNVSSAVGKDRPELRVSSVNAISQSDTCIWVSVVYEADNHVLLPGVLIDHPSRLTNSSKCPRGFYRRKSPSKADAAANNNILWTPSKIITVGQKVWCYRHSYSRPIDNAFAITKELQVERRTMFSISIRLILPPTLLFIAGFVSLFFSCVYWQSYS